MLRIRAFLFVGVLLVACGAGQTPQATSTPPTPTQATIALATLTPELPTAIPVTITAEPSPTAQATEYTIVAGDTLWDIAVRFGASLDEMVLANPGINPDLLHPGDVINLPGASVALAPIQTAAPAPTANATELAAVSTSTASGSGNKTNSAVSVSNAANARVAADADLLRLRRGPSTRDGIITHLAALTPLIILQRSADEAWLEVSLTDGTRGWVMAQYVDTGKAAVLSVDALPRPEPYLSGFTNRAREIYHLGLEMGNHPNVFAIIGDSNSASPLYLEPFDHGNYNLGDYGYLQDTNK